MSLNENAEQAWARVEGALTGATAIAFEGCHKIYVALDEKEAQTFVDLGYNEDGASVLYLGKDVTYDEALAKLHEWFDQACGLKFISAVKSVPGDPNEGFSRLIEQFEDWFADEDEDEDVEA